MSKNTKIILGCCGGAIFISGGLVGGFINEKINQKYTQPSIERYRKLSEYFKELLVKEYETNDILKKEVLKMKREEATGK